MYVFTNINRQIHANHKTVGKPKVEVMKERIMEINPKVEVTTYQEFFYRRQGVILSGRTMTIL